MINILIASAALALAGCAGFVHPVKTELRVVMPEQAYFVCEKVELPDPNTLDDVQIASLINQLVKANRTCANNMNGIRDYLNAAKQVLEDRKSTESK